MEVEQAIQNLPTPVFHCPNVNSLVFLPISTQLIKNENPIIKISQNRITQINQSNEIEEQKIINPLLYLLSESTRGEHFCDKINIPIISINPRSVELHDVAVFQSLEQMNFTIQPFKFFWTLQKIIKLYLIPGHFNPFILIKSSVTAPKKNWRRKMGERTIKNIPIMNNSPIMLKNLQIFRQLKKLS